MKHDPKQTFGVGMTSLFWIAVIVAWAMILKG
jgi:hypothetical protein